MPYFQVGCWSINYPEPVLTPQMRRDSARRVANKLLELAAGKPLNDPETWCEIAANLSIELDPFTGHHDSSRGCLTYRGRLDFSNHRDQWILEWNTAYSKREQAEALIHELAHWFLRTGESDWLCDYPIVYWYEGPVKSEHHKIARSVEWRVLGRRVKLYGKI